jgi:AcrR family transcriptional regulator
LPKIVDHEKRREEILANCFELFAQRGYAALTMREIAQALEVSTGTLYHYFDGKRELFHAMFEWISQSDVEAVALEIPSDIDLDQRLYLLRMYLFNRAQHLSDVIRIGIEFQRRHPDAEGEGTIQLILNAYRTAIRNQLDLEVTQEVNAILSFILGTLLHSSFDSQVKLEDQLLFLGLISTVPQLKVGLD